MSDEKVPVVKLPVLSKPKVEVKIDNTVPLVLRLREEVKKELAKMPKPETLEECREQYEKAVRTALKKLGCLSEN